MFFTDLQLDVLSSVVPSAMAPSSGLSYQAEPVDNRPTASAIRLPLNLNDLFQRLVETGIVSSLTEMKKPEEEEKNEAEIVPVTFNKSETLKMYVHLFCYQLSVHSLLIIRTHIKQIFLFI